MENLRIDGDRLWASIMEMAKIGATEKGGVCRLALTDLDREGRDLFVKWCEEAGCSVEVDAIGNIFARRPGRDESLPAVMTGSHLDTQPTGGRFDGIYGVLAGLEVIRSLNDAGYQTERAVEVAVWTNEEGSRFAPAMLGSGAYSRALDPAWCLERQDAEGRSVAAELARIGYAGERPIGGRPLDSYFEAHIEQGPVLEAAGERVGVVTGAQGQRWYEVTVTGQEAHAGPTPMPVRRDALVGAAAMVQLVNRIGRQFPPHACSTCGMLQVHPNSRNVIPGRVWFTVDLRHPDDATLAEMDALLRAGLAEIAAESGLELAVEQIWAFPATPFDPDCVAAVRAAAAAAGHPGFELVSGAGHDAVYMARVVPTAMVFVPCEGGISHNEIENAAPEDLEAGCNVLLQAMLQRADRGAAEG